MLNNLFDYLPAWAPLAMWLAVFLIVSGLVGHFFGWKVGAAVFVFLIVVAAIFVVWLNYMINTSE